MSFILLSSIFLRAAAFLWSLVLWSRIRDWRLGLLSLLVALMAARQSLTLARQWDPWSISFNANLDEIPGLLVSLLVGLVTVFVGGMIQDRKRSEERWGALFANVPDQITELDLEGRVLRAHNSLGQMQPASVVGSAFAPSLSVGERPLFAKKFQHITNSGQPESYEYSQNIDGQEAWSLTRIVPRRAGGEITGYVVIRSDITALKQAQSDLETQGELNRKIVSTVPEILFIFDVHSRLPIYVNRTVVETLLYDAEEIRAMGGRFITELLHPGDIANLNPFLQECKSAGDEDLVEFEFRLKAKDETWRWFHLRAAIFSRDKNGEVTQIIGTVEDTTASKLGELSLIESEERFRQVFENAPIGVALADVPGRVIQVNGQLCEMLGYSAEEVLGKTFPELTHPEDREETSRQVREALRGESEGPRLEKRYIRKDGSTLSAIVNSTLQRDSKGEPEFFITQIVDITQRKEAEAALQNRIEFERLITKLSTKFINLSAAEVPEGIQMALGAIGNFAEVDRCYVLYFSDDRKTFSCANEWCASGIDPQLDQMQEVPCSLYSFALDYLLRGEVFHVPRVEELPAEGVPEKETLQARGIRSMIMVPMMSGGEAVGFLGFDSARQDSAWTDDTITLLQLAGGIFVSATQRTRAEKERVELEEQVRHTQKLESLGVLAGGIAHDFNNLLVGILGNADLALLDLPKDAAHRDCLNEIVTASQRAAELCKQMLAYSGRGKFVVESVHLSSMIEDLSKLLELSISKTIDLKFDFQNGLPLVEADISQLRQVAINLVLNASEAIGDRAGQVTISTSSIHCDRAFLNEIYIDGDLPEGTYVCLEVTDSGSGMDERTQARIFDPFFSTKFTGRGLGLAAVLGIVRGHNGAIRVESNPESGSTFQVLLPSAVPEAVTADGATIDASSQWAKPGQVLVIDDEEIVRSLATRMLELAGFRALSACDGIEGLDMIRRDPAQIDAVLLDLTMPRMNGEETFQEIRKIRDDLPVILSSGFSEQDVPKSFQDASSLAGFVQKPYTSSALLKTIRHALDSKSASGV